jgi:hypothetical protein
MPMLTFITHLILFAKDWNKQLLLQLLLPLLPPASNLLLLVWMKTLHRYSPSTIVPCVRADVDADDDVDYNARNTPQIPIDIAPFIEGQAI